MRVSTIAAPVLLAGVAHAQLAGIVGGLSSSCQAAATTLISGGFGTCINALGLVGVLSADGSVVAPLNSWLSGLCAQTCSNETLTTTASTIDSGCASDLASSSSSAVALDTLTSQYPALKSALCLQSSSNSSYCLTNLLADAERATGTNLTTDTITQLISGSGLTSFVSQLSPSVVCTDCTHGLISKLTPVLGATTGNSSTSATVGSYCGASFTDGQVPSTLQESTGGTGTSGTPSGTASNTAVSSTNLGAATAGVRVDGGVLAAMSFVAAGVIGGMALL